VSGRQSYTKPGSHRIPTQSLGGLGDRRDKSDKMQNTGEMLNNDFHLAMVQHYSQRWLNPIGVWCASSLDIPVIISGQLNA